MRHFVTISTALLAAATFVGCGSDDPSNLPTDPSPIAVTETFTGTLTVNGAQTHEFAVDRAGTVTAQITELSTADATIGISLGTFNGAACQIIISNTSATLSTSIAGTAQTTGRFCVWINDVGRLGGAVAYTINVTHF